MATLSSQALQSFTVAVGAGPAKEPNTIATNSLNLTDVSANIVVNSCTAALLAGPVQLQGGSLSDSQGGTYLYSPSADTWQFNAASTGAVTVTGSTAANGIIFGASGRRIGFYGTGPVAVQNVTGSKAANAALTSLIAALVAVGLITDGTS